MTKAAVGGRRVTSPFTSACHPERSEFASAAEGFRGLPPCPLPLLPHIPPQCRRRFCHATASDVRQMLGTTRRVLIPLLEHLDKTGWTRRVGDRRALR